MRLFEEFVKGKEMIATAQEFATKKHEGQTRKFSGEAYINHPATVAALVQQYGGNPDQIAAAWLHDVVEDCKVKIETIQKKFGPKVSSLVGELTNPPEIDKGQKKTEYMAKKITTMSSEGLTVKLCDRLNNVSDFDTAKPKFVQSYAPKTRFILNALEDSGRPLNSQQIKLVAEIDKAITPHEDPH